MSVTNDSKAVEVRAVGPDVFYCVDETVRVGAVEIDLLKAHARNSARRRSRLCLHPNTDAAVHEMVIVHHRDVYVRPHRHLVKAESFHLIEGDAAVVLFTADGSVREVIEVSGERRAPFYVRIAAGVYHGFLIRSEWLVFHETTSGPFDRSEMEFAPWSPEEQDRRGVSGFLDKLSGEVALYAGAAR